MTGATPAHGEGERIVRVLLLGLPLQVHVRASEHGQELRRELTLVHHRLEQPATGPGAVPRRLIELTDALQGRYAAYTVEQEDLLDRAVDAGDETVDLTFEVPAHAAGAAEELGHILDEADAYCREGKHLLTLATPPEALTYRRWYLQQFVDQIAGRPPQAWDDWARTRSGPDNTG